MLYRPLPERRLLEADLRPIVWTSRLCGAFCCPRQPLGAMMSLTPDSAALRRPLRSPSPGASHGTPPRHIRRIGLGLAACLLAIVAMAGGPSPAIAEEAGAKTTLTIIKRVIPPRDRGRFDLLIDGVVRARAVGNGGSTGAVPVKPGRHRVSERAAKGTRLGAYTGVVSGACDSKGRVTLKAGESKTCIITNKPKPTDRTTLRVDKIVVPNDGRGRFNLTIDGVVRATDVGNGGSTGAVPVAPGVHTVAETAGANTSLSNYVPRYGGDCDADGKVTVALGDYAVCTITNTRMQWTTKNSMPTARLYFGIGAIGNHIYVVGGGTSYLVYYAALERYTPATNTWATMAPLPAKRYGLAVGVVNGILYAVGGQGYTSTGWGASGRVEAYDPATDTWTTKASMPTAREGLGVGVVNGILYAVGGQVSGAVHPMATLQAYDPATDTWTTKAPMPTARAYLTAVGHGGKLYAIGGFGPYFYSGNLALVQVYDPATDSWTTAAPMSAARRGVAVTTAHGFIYAIGGNSGGTVFGLAQRYDAATNTWTTIAPMPTPRSFAGAATVGSRFYAIGGFNLVTPYATNQSYEPW